MATLETTAFTISVRFESLGTLAITVDLRDKGRFTGYVSFPRMGQFISNVTRRWHVN
jgi:hypothetical protein